MTTFVSEEYTSLLTHNATLCKEALGKVFVAYYHFVSEALTSGIQKLFGAVASGAKF